MKYQKEFTFAILIPSYKRKEDLIHTVSNTPLCGLAKFLIVANYDEDEYKKLEDRLSDKAIFINEQLYGKLGASGAFNLAYKKSIELGFNYSILYADDVIPFEKDWLATLLNIINYNKVQFGIFSTDECHPGYFGWNIIKDSPIAHFFVIKNGLTEYLFKKAFRQYVIDFEIAVRLIKQGTEIHLLPIRLNHLRSHLNREHMSKNYLYDSNVFYKMYPEYCLYMDKFIGKKYIPHHTSVIKMKDVKSTQLQVYPGLKKDIITIFLQTVKGFIKFILYKLVRKSRFE